MFKSDTCVFQFMENSFNEVSRNSYFPLKSDSHRNTAEHRFPTTGIPLMAQNALRHPVFYCQEHQPASTADYWPGMLTAAFGVPTFFFFFF